MAFFAKAVVVGLDADPKDLEKGFDRAGKKLDEFEGKAKTTGDKAGGSFVNMGAIVQNALFPIGTIMAGVGLASLKSAGEMQKMNVALETAFQGNKEEAAKASKAITEFASTTPYQLGEVQGAFVKLKNMGLDPSKAAMTSYGDTASAMGKSLNDMVEAVADAATGEFERLKEFGIRSSSEGDRVKFTFKGVTTEVGKNSEEIQSYLKKLGETNFAGGMDAQSKTLLGSLSTLTDSISLKLAEVADSSGLTQFATDAVAGLGKVIGDFKLENLKMVAPIFAGIGIAAAVSLIPSTAAVAAFGVAIWTAMAPLLPFVALAAGIAVAIYLIQQNWSVLQPYFDQFATMAMSVLNPALQFLGNMITTQLVPAFNNMLTALKPVWEFIEPMLLPALKILGAIIGVVIVGSILLFIGALMMIVQNLTAVAQGVTAFCQMVQFGWTNMTTILGTVWNAIWDTIKSYTAAVFLSLYYIFTGQSDKVAGVWSAFGTKINEIWSGAWATVSGYLAGVWGQIGGHFEALGANITGFFAGVNLEQMGKDMIQGLINGLQSMGSSLINSITGLVNNAVNAAKNALGIHSPSVLLKEEIGINMMKGINEGLAVEAPRVQNTLEDKLMAMSQIRIPSAQISDQITGSYSSSRVQTNSVDSHDTYVTNNNNEPKDRPGFGWLETA